MNTRQQRVFARRMIHRSRSTAVVVTLSAVALVAAWAGVEEVLRMLGPTGLALSPQSVVAAVVASPALAALTAAALAVVGLVLVVIAVTPGRRGRRVLADDRALIIADDAVLAGAISRSAATAARVPPGQTRTALGRRRADVSVVPLSGYPVSGEAVDAAVDATLRAASPTGGTAARVRIDTRGRIPA